MELDQRESDTSANQSLDSMGIDTGLLFRQALEQTRMAIAIADPHQSDDPIVYVNQAFVELTGYEREEAIGRNCRFLQGEKTDPEAPRAIREALEGERVEVVEILNYRKDGSTFWNALHVGPIYDASGRLTHHYGSQWDVTDVVEKRQKIALQAEVAEELQHRTGNLFGVIASIVRLSARHEKDAAVLADKVTARIQALGKAHAISIAKGSDTPEARDLRAPEARDLRDLVATILEPYHTGVDSRIVLEGPAIQVPRAAVTPLGLMLHELATNALKYGAFQEITGSVTVAWQRHGDRLRLTWLERGGPNVELPSGSGMGSRIVDSVLKVIGASIDYDWPPEGLNATLDMALDPEQT